jgi:hypothetical protein
VDLVSEAHRARAVRVKSSVRADHKVVG